MDDILITADFMKSGWVLVVPLILIGILTYIFNSKLIEWLFAFIKAFYYGFLAYIMWKYVQVNSMQDVGMVTAFTCILCCIECGDNSVKVIGMALQVLKEFIISLKKGKNN